MLRFRCVPRWALIVFACAVAARIGFLVAVGQGWLQVSFESTDSMLYRELADELRTGAYRRDSEPTAAYTPGYPLFLAVLFTFGTSTLYISVVQAVLGGFTAVLIGATAGRIGGPRAGLWAGLAFALYPHLVYWSGFVLSEALYLFWLAVALYLGTRVLQSPSPGWAAAAGGACGAAVLVRPVLLGFVLLVGLLGAVRSSFRGRTAVGLAVLVLVLTPWVVRNAVTLDGLVVGSTESGFVLWSGNNPAATGGIGGGGGPSLVDRGAKDYEPVSLTGKESEVEKDRAYREAAIRWMTSQPGELAALLPKKFWNMWRPTERDTTGLWGLLLVSTYLVVLTLGLAGLSRAVARRARGGALLLALVVYSVLVHLALFGLVRYRVPVEAVLTIGVGLAVAAVLDRTRGREPSATGARSLAQGQPRSC